MTWNLLNGTTISPTAEPTAQQITDATNQINAVPTPPVQPLVLGTTIWSRFTSDQQAAIQAEAAKQWAAGSKTLATWVRNTKFGMVINLNSPDTTAVQSVLSQNNVIVQSDLSNVFTV